MSTSQERAGFAMRGFKRVADSVKQARNQINRELDDRTLWSQLPEIRGDVDLVNDLLDEALVEIALVRGKLAKVLGPKKS